MKRLLSIIALAACLSFAGCDKDREWSPLLLDGSESVNKVIAPINNASLDITGGSGNFAATIDDQQIANVSIVGGEIFSARRANLVIKPKKEGEALITVTDRKSGFSATCALTVTMAARRISFRFNDIVTHVDADAPEAIEADLAADTRWVKGGGIDLGGYSGEHQSNGDLFVEIAFVGAEKRYMGTETLGLSTEAVEWNPAFDFMPVGGNQLEVGKRLVFARGSEEWTADYYVVKGSYTRLNMPGPVQVYHRRFYEDMTEYYRAKFPEAGVRSVARAIISNVE